MLKKIYGQAVFIHSSNRELPKRIFYVLSKIPILVVLTLGSPAALTQELSEAAKLLNQRFETAIKNNPGAKSKQEWKDVIGIDHPEYKLSDTHMPGGMGFASGIDSTNETSLTKKSSDDYAQKRAGAMLLGLMGREATISEIRAYRSQQTEYVSYINQRMSFLLPPSEPADRKEVVPRIEQELKRQRVLLKVYETQEVPLPQGNISGFMPANELEIKRAYTELLNRFSKLR